MFHIFRKREQKNEDNNSKNVFPDSQNINLRNVWNISDRSSFILAISDKLCNKSDNGNHINNLSDKEKIIYITLQLEAEVNNGGFSQYFINSSGDFLNEVIFSLEQIGANKVAHICKKAIETLGCDLPLEKGKREEVLDKLLTDEVSAILDEWDTEFYKYPENLEELNYQFIIENKEYFS